MTNTESALSTINVQMKSGILNTIANSIYSDPKVKIREAVANSMDNCATWFIIYADRPSLSISLIDNGRGITKQRFDEIFESIGCGMEKANLFSNSYFGLGLLSILALGQNATVITRSGADNQISKLEINSKTIFSDEMRAEPLSSVSKLLSISSSDLAERERLSNLPNGEIERLVGQFPGSFTEIILEGIDSSAFELITSEDFETDLRKTLPLKARDDEPFLKSIKDPSSLEWLIQAMGNRDFCPTIDVHFGISEGERELAQLWKYFPDFRKDLQIGAADIAFGESEGKFPDGKSKFTYYYLYSTDDLEERGKTNTETGFWVRNKNFLIKEADYFQKPGSRKKIIHEPLKNWLFGEIFHRDMTKFLIVTRNEYVWESTHFESFYEEIKSLVYHLNQKLRDVWKNSREVADSLIKPFAEIRSNDNPFFRSYRALSEIGIIKDPQDTSEILRRLYTRRDPELEADDKRIDKILEQNKDIIVLADDSNMKVVIDPKVDPQLKFTKQREEQSSRIIVRISPSIFSPEQTTFLGKTFDIFYVMGGPSSKAISINDETYKIYINPFNIDFAKYSLSFIDVFIAVEIADLYSDDKPQMKNYLLQLLGFKLTPSAIDPKKYLFSLKDELQRRYGSAA